MSPEPQLPPGNPFLEERPPLYRWYHKVAGLVWVIFCFELGVFLLVFPWLDQWDRNYFAYFVWLSASSARQVEIAQWWHAVWMSPYFKGAVGGLGLVNIYISLREIFGLRRFAAPVHPEEPSGTTESESRDSLE